MSFEKNKIPLWDLGGTLNERDPPSEVPPRDFIEVNNWKVHDDNKSRVKRPGYTKLDAGYTSVNVPIRGIFEYEDINDNQHIVIVTRDAVVHRENVYAWAQQFEDTDADYVIGYRQALLYNDKLVLIDHGPDVTKLQILASTDGSTFAALDDRTYTCNVANAWGIATMNNEILFGIYTAAPGGNVIMKWDGVTTFNQQCPVPDAGTYVQHLHNWDGKIWILTYANGGTKYLIYYWNGTSYSAIGNYDGGADIPTNSAQKIINDVSARAARFFTWNNQLYLFVTIKDSVSTKWNFQIWRFNETLYDRFTLVYDNDGVADDYGLCAVYEYEDKIWIILQKLDYVADASPDGNDNKIYSSENMTEWTLENGSMTLGCVMGEEVFEGKVFINTLWDYATNKYTKLFYWDKSLSNFVAEQTITTDVPPGAESTGDLIVFNGELYVTKYREVYKRELSSNQYSEILSSSEEISEPVSGVYWDSRYYLAIESNIALEGSDVHSLGIIAPDAAPSVASASPGKMTGEYMVVVTFQRSGNYPCESNPSPESATVELIDDNITISAANNKIDFQETAATPLVATLTDGSYTPFLLCAEIKKQLDSIGDSAHTVARSGGVYTIASSGLGGGGIFELLCNTGANKANAVWSTVGFDDTTDKTGALIYDGEAETAHKISLTNIPLSTDPKVNARRIYITTAGGARFYWIEDIADNSTVALVLNYRDDTILGGDEVSYDRYPPPAGSLMEVWDNKLWIAGVPGYPNMLFYTNSGTSEEMSNRNFIPFKRRESDKIEQIKSFGDAFYVIKGESMFAVYKVGIDLYEVRELPQNIGTDAPWSVAVCDIYMIWKSKFGIEIFNGNRCYRPVLSRLVKRTMASINKDALNKIVGGHNFSNGEYWLAIPTGSNTEPDTVIVYEYIKERFTVYTFPKKLTYLTSLTSRIEGLTFLTGTDDGYVYIQDSGFDDDGAAISSNFRTGWFFVSGEREVQNVLRRMFMKYICPATFTLTVKIYADFSKDAITTLSFPGFTPSTTPELRNERLGRQNLRIPGFYVSFDFINNEKNTSEIRVIGWDLYFRKNLWRYSVEGD